MGSRKLLNVIALALLPWLLAACDGTGWYHQPEDANIIGTKLDDMSSLNDDVGTQINKIAVYDETVSRIHQFDLNTMNVERSLAIMNPGIPHTVLYNLPGNYVIDFTTKHLSVYDRYGRPTHNPIRFVGTPVSAAYRPSMGLIVIYDSLSSVGMMRMGANGEVTKKWKGGPDLGGNRTIAAGDIDDGGRLVLALSDGTVVKVDMDATMDSGNWTLTGSPIATGLTEITWLAPVRGQPDQVMVATKSQIAILDTQSQTVIGTPTTFTGTVVKRTKGIDAHVVTSDYTAGGVWLYYASGGAILTKRLQRVNGMVTHSRLDMSGNSLTLVTAGSYKWNYSTKSILPPPEPTDRMIRQWRFSDLDAQVEEKVRDGAKLALATRSLFALVPDPLGWALNYDLFSGGPPADKRGFNVPYIP